MNSQRNRIDGCSKLEPDGARLRILAVVLAAATTLAAFGAPRPTLAAEGTGSTTVVLVALTEGKIPSEAKQILATATAAGVALLSPDEVSLRLRGVAADCSERAPSANNDSQRECFRPVDEARLAAMLQEAHVLEGYFKTGQADVLRTEVLTAYQRTPQPTPAMRQLAGDSLLGRASGQYAESKADEAMKFAREAMRHFNATTIDVGHYSPPLQKLFAKARQAANRESTVDLRVRTNQDGELWADGNNLGRIRGETRVRLSPGRYRLWVQPSERSLSLPYEVLVANKGGVIELDPVLDERLTFGHPTQLRCVASECESLTSRLRRRLDATMVIGLGNGPSGAVEALVVTATGPARWMPISELEKTLGLQQRKNAAPEAATSAPAPNVSTTSPLLQRKWLAVASASVGALAIGTGIVLGVRSRSTLRRAASSGITQVEYDSLNKQGKQQGLAANILLGLGVAGLGTGAVLYFYADW